MIESEILGRRIKYFRERERVNQLDLELEIKASTGTLSRIENGKINPTKETVLKISRVLGLNNMEVDYLIGMTAKPATLAEVDSAKKEVEKYFKGKVLSYLIDDRWRLWEISDFFLKVLNLDRDYIKKHAGTATIEFGTNSKLGIVDRFSPKYLDQVLYHNLRYFYKEVGFMHDDEYYQKAVKSIMSSPIGQKHWPEIVRNRDTDYSFRIGRIVYFQVLGFDVPLVYSYEQLLGNSRFKVVEYVPTNKLLKLMKNFL
jgi:transcriptional regulator with XRE-family HTH domain